LFAAYIERASRLNPADLPTLYTLGQSCLRAKNYSRVVDVFRRIMAVNPASPKLT